MSNTKKERRWRMRRIFLAPPEESVLRRMLEGALREEIYESSPPEITKGEIERKVEEMLGELSYPQLIVLYRLGYILRVSWGIGRKVLLSELIPYVKELKNPEDVDMSELALRTILRMASEEIKKEGAA